MIVTNATPTNDMEQLAVLNLNIALALYNWLLHVRTLIELAVYYNSCLPCDIMYLSRISFG